jgi:hypothetical protein
MSNLASVSEALTMQGDVLQQGPEARRRAQGEEHPDTLIGMSNPA